MLLLGSDLLSPSPFILTGAEIASILLTNALQCNVLPSTGISRTQSRVGQNFGANFAPTGRARAASISSVGIRLSKTVIFTVLSSVCTTSENEEKLLLLLQPLFNGKNKIKQGDEDEKNKIKMEPKIALEIEVIDSNNNNNDNNKSSEKNKKGRKKSKKNQKLNSNINVNLIGNLTANFDDEKIPEKKIEKKVEEETQSKRISDMLRKLSISNIDGKLNDENIFQEKNTENENDNKNENDTKILSENENTSINFGDEINGNKSTILDSKTQNEPNSLKLKANDTDFGIEEIYLFINQSIEIQQFFEFEIKNILYQIVSASTRYSIDT